MVDLPPELWLRIAQFVPDADIFRLASVNRLFLDLAVDRRYRQLNVDDDRPAVLIQKLARVQQDPQVAKRVRSLIVHPKAVRSACLRASKNTRGRLRPVASEHWPDAFRIRAERFPMEEDVELADVLLDSLSRLCDLEELTIEWKLGTDAERSFCLPMLSAIWTLHGAHLRVVRLDMVLSQLCDMVAPVNGLERIEELSLHFTSTDPRLWVGPGSETKRAFEQLAAFMNRLTPSLQSLAISSIGHLNFSLLYNNLIYFPLLNYLSLHVPCDPRHVVDPTGFHNFLSAHRNIEHFSFSPQYCCHQSSLSPGPQNGYTSTEDWLDRVFGGIDLQNLHSLELGLNILGSGGKRVLPPVPRIGSAVKRARSLRVLGCMISLEDISTLLYPFSQVACGSNPRSLALEVHVLDIALLNLLADYLPRLEILDLTYRWVGRSGCTDVSQFTKDLKTKRYTCWESLWRLILRCSRQDDDSRWPCQHAISKCIPRLQR